MLSCGGYEWLRLIISYFILSWKVVMTRVHFIVVCLFTLLVIPGQALAEERTPFYVGAKLGVSLMGVDDVKNTTQIANRAAINKKSEEDTLLMLGGTIGYDWSKSHDIPVRTELEYMVREDFGYKANPTFKNALVATKTNVDMAVQTVLANVYYDFDTGTAFTPFIGGGIGYAFLQSDADVTVIATDVKSSKKREETNFVWQIGGGVAYDISDHWTLDTSYRYLDMGSMEWGAPTNLGIKADEITAHEVVMGLRYTF